METSTSDFFCIKEASAYSGLALAELYRLARTGGIPFFYEGRQMRFYALDLDSFLEQDAASISQDIKNHPQ